jgi:hypothetical protein
VLTDSNPKVRRNSLLTETMEQFKGFFDGSSHAMNPIFCHFGKENVSFKIELIHFFEQSTMVMIVIFALDAAIVRTTGQQKHLLPNNWVMSFIRRDVHDV